MSGILLCSECFTAHAIGSEVETIAIAPNSYNAYLYWFSNGYNQTYDPSVIENNQESVNFSITGSESSSQSLGYITGCLTVPAGSQNNTAYNLTTGCNVNQTTPINLTISNGNTTVDESVTGSVSSLNAIIYNYKLPWLSGTYVHEKNFVNSKSIYINGISDTYISFYSSKNLFRGSSAQLAGLANYYVNPDLPAEITASRVNYATPNAYFCTLRLHADLKNNQGYTLITLDFPSIDNDTKIIPLYVGNGADLDDNTKTVYNIQTNAEKTLIEQTQDQTKSLVSNQNSIWNQQNSTTQISELKDTSDGLISSGNEKFRNLLYPIQWVADEALSLANAPSTGQVTLPAIFSNDYWVLDLTSIENNLPEAWAFIQNMCRLAVAGYLIYGLINTFRGGVNDS